MKYDLIYFVGDSFTWAAGFSEDINKEITLKTRWTKQVADYFSLPEVNAGRGGVSTKYIYHKLVQDITEFKKQNINPLVVVFYSYFNRQMETYTKKHGLRVISHSEEYPEDFILTFVLEFGNEKYMYINQIAAILAIQNFLKVNDIDFIDSCIENIEMMREYLDKRALKEYPNLTYNMIDTYRMLLPNLQTLVEPNCFLLPNGMLGHWNVEGNKIVKDAVIKKALELYRDNFN